MAQPPAWEPPPQIDEYRLIRRLGSGAMGVVYLAHDELLDRAVAVKFISTESPDAMARARFSVEARAAARVQHPNVVAVHRVAELGSRPFIVTEYLRGESLSALHRPLPWSRVLELGIGLARGLAAAHRSGVLHRDLKPSNAFLTEDGTVKLLDFGLAKLRGDGRRTAAKTITREAVPVVVPLAASTLVAADDTLPSAAAPMPVRNAPAPAADQGTGTRVGAIMGSPLYMPPEAWRGEPATPRGDVYSLGALLYELAVGEAPFAGVEISRLPAVAQVEDLAPVATRASGIDPGFAEVLDRCLARDPSQRYADAGGLLEALESLAVGAGDSVLPEGNPYRGLLAFEERHRAVFFGRAAETRTIIEHLRAQRFVVVTADSGVGKSSVVRAGVLPAVNGAGALGADLAVVTLTPGTRALHALASALAGLLSEDVAAVEQALREQPAEVARQLRLRQPHGVLIVIDQLEEVFTLGLPEDRPLFALALTALVLDAQGALALCTLRSDYVREALAMPGIGEVMARALHLLRPLEPERWREAVVGPARAFGFRFESEEMVDALIKGADGSLPLLQFALAELWERRNVSRRELPRAALEELGGVAGALTRHADDVLAALPSPQREAARRILVALVSPEGTSARRTDAELRALHEEAPAALAALVRSRLVIPREGMDDAGLQLAHDALIRSWSTLRDWLEGAQELKLLRARIERAAAEWQRLGQAPDALFGAAQLEEAARVEARTLTQEQRAFLEKSRAALARRRWSRRGAAAGITLAVVLASAPFLKSRYDAGQERALHLSLARGIHDSATEGARQASDARRVAFAAFDQVKPEAESLWEEALRLTAAADASFEEATHGYLRGLEADPMDEALRGGLRQLLLDRIRFALDTLRPEEVKRATALAAEQKLELGPQPEGRVMPPAPAIPSKVPEGFVYVPPGSFLFGSGRDEGLRKFFLNAQPLHEVSTAGFFIARHEVTFAEWLTFLDSLPPEERRARTPSVNQAFNGLSLERTPAGAWRLLLMPSTQRYAALEGEPIRYSERELRAVQDWRRFPVAAISWDDAVRYARWANETGRVPGARLCTDHEWERAARGVDDRLFPSGAELQPDDANFDLTYGQKPGGFGPDEVGSHPGSRSPFGVDDLAGNVWEWTSGHPNSPQPVIRGGCWYQGRLSMLIPNREPVEANHRDPLIGMRLCADAPPVP